MLSAALRKRYHHLPCHLPKVTHEMADGILSRKQLMIQTGDSGEGMDPQTLRRETEALPMTLAFRVVHERVAMQVALEPEEGSSDIRPLRPSIHWRWTYQHRLFPPPRY
jgi:hypothetical protein